MYYLLKTVPKQGCFNFGKSQNYQPFAFFSRTRFDATQGLIKNRLVSDRKQTP